MASSRRRRRRYGFAIQLSRPFRAVFQRFSFVVLIIVAVVCIGIGNKYDTISQHIRMAVVDMATPALEVAVWPFHKMAKGIEGVQHYFFVYEKNIDLLEENKYLRRQLAVLSNVKAESLRLKKLLNAVKEVEYSYITARVVGNAMNPFSRSMLINAGKKEGIKKDQAVINEDGLIGRIVEVGETSSRVLLITDINSRVPVVSMASRERVLMAGDNSEEPELLYVPMETSLQQGEQVITSGDGKVFPSGLAVGIISAAKDNAYRIKPLVKWNNIENVTILKYQGNDDEAAPLRSPRPERVSKVF